MSTNKATIPEPAAPPISIQPIPGPAVEAKPAKKKLSLEITEVEEVLERKISP